MKPLFTEEERRWRIIKFKVLERQIENAFKFFRKNQIEPVLLKGWAASRKYPEKYQRFFSDIDLAVAPDLYGKALKLVEENQLLIDLHCGLRHLDKVEWSVLFENSVLVKLDESEIRVLSEEDHLRVLCVHWLIDGGAYKDKLWDIFYAVENRSETFEWEKCLNTVSSNRRVWIIYTIGLAHKYLDLSIADLPFEKEARQIPVWLIKTVEREWKSSVKLRPIHTCLNDWREVFRQVIKRVPPNPIQSTVEMEGSFDEGLRAKYQIKSVLSRITPSLERIVRVISS